MTEITIKIPDEIKKLVDEIEEPLYVEAIKDIARKKLAEKRQKLSQVQKHIKKFEKKYSNSYEEFSKNVPSSQIGHDDWIEWTFLNQVRAELTDNIKKLEMLLPQ